MLEISRSHGPAQQGRERPLIGQSHARPGRLRAGAPSYASPGLLHSSHRLSAIHPCPCPHLTRRAMPRPTPQASWMTSPSSLLTSPWPDPSSSHCTPTQAPARPAYGGAARGGSGAAAGGARRRGSHTCACRAAHPPATCPAPASPGRSPPGCRPRLCLSPAWPNLGLGFSLRAPKQRRPLSVPSPPPLPPPSPQSRGLHDRWPPRTPRAWFAGAGRSCSRPAVVAGGSGLCCSHAQRQGASSFDTCVSTC